jgi:hypothetical protein
MVVPVAAAEPLGGPGSGLILPTSLDGQEQDQEKSPTFADVIRTFGPEYRRRHGPTITEQQDRALRELVACWTPLMGTHAWTCDDCGTVVELPNSCNNRHCPTCGEGQRQIWAETTLAQLLPVEYYHVILTVPRPITLLAMANPRLLYPIMLHSGGEAIRRCGRKLFQLELALLSLLHTWGQILNSHLHSHSMLPAGGLWLNGRQWIDLSPEQIQRLLEGVSWEFPERFLKALRKAHKQGQLVFGDEPELEGLESPGAFQRWLEPVSHMAWVVRCPQVWDRRQASQDPEAAARTVAYLARYANRVALSNKRIVAIEDDQVLLRYKDYRDGGAVKIASIGGVELIGRFLKHLLPKGMHHIRRYGWMGRRTKNEKLQWLRAYFGVGEPDAVEKPQAADNEDADTDVIQTEEVEPAAGDETPSRPCRYCSGTMHLAHTTRRPKVSEILQMPRAWFWNAQAGPIITLGQKLKDAAKVKDAAKSADTSRSRGPPA